MRMRLVGRWGRPATAADRRRRQPAGGVEVKGVTLRVGMGARTGGRGGEQRGGEQKKEGRRKEEGRQEEKRKGIYIFIYI